MDAAFLSHLNLGTISKVTPVGGGDINQAFRLESSTGPVFLLLQPDHKKEFFTHEVNGLACLAPFVKTPQVLRIGEWGNNAYLVLSNGGLRWFSQKSANQFSQHGNNFSWRVRTNEQTLRPECDD